MKTIYRFSIYSIQGVPKKNEKTIEITIVKIWMPFQTAERNDA